MKTYVVRIDDEADQEAVDAILVQNGARGIEMSDVTGREDLPYFIVEALQDWLELRQNSTVIPKSEWERVRYYVEGDETE